MMGWKEVELGDVLRKIIGGGTPSKANPLYWDGDISWCSVKDMEIGKYKVDSTEDKISLLGLKNSASNLIKKGTVITATRMGLGRVFINSIDLAINQDLKALIPNEKIDNKFLLFTILEKAELIDSLGSGATVKGIRLETLKSIRIFLPPLPIQRRIAAILSSYDDLIENNGRRIRLLEEIAQRTYEEWFVRFRVGGQQLEVEAETGLPKGWERKKLWELVGFEIGGGWGDEVESDEFPCSGYVIRGTDMENIQSGSLEKVPHRFHKLSNMASRKIQDGDIIFEVSGGSTYEGVAKTLVINEELLRQFDDDIMCASFCKLLRPTNKNVSYFLFLNFRFLRMMKTTEIWEIRSASNIVNYNWTAFLKFQEIKLPGETLLKSFSDFVSPVYDNIYKLGKQNLLLKQSRDLLLPRLMNGIISVARYPEIEQDVQLAAEDETPYNARQPI